jgi:hypothetical protein
MGELFRGEEGSGKAVPGPESHGISAKRFWGEEVIAQLADNLRMKPKAPRVPGLRDTLEVTEVEPEADQVHGQTTPPQNQ